MAEFTFPFPFGGSDEEDDCLPMPLPEAACLTLKEIAETYQKPCPFQAGDLVMPRRGYWLRGDGEPHIVLEVYDPPIRIFPREDGESVMSVVCGARLDIRVAGMSTRSRNITPFSAESWAYEPYKTKDEVSQ